MADISSGSPEFDQLRKAVMNDPRLRFELERAFMQAVEMYNPSDRGLRFITGGIGEWIVTLAAYNAGIVTLPGGHNADHHDTVSVREAARGLWSVKTSYKAGGIFTITNGQNGPGAGLVVPTIFLSPEFPGIVYVSPTEHPEMVAKVYSASDSTKLRKADILEFALEHPECVIPFDMPVNPGGAVVDPSLEAVRLIVDNASFPRLRAMFAAQAQSSQESKSVIQQLKELEQLRASGVLNPDQFEAAVNQITGLTP